ncbi:MAG: signal peptidase II [Chlamydiota bacterium]
MKKGYKLTLLAALILSIDLISKYLVQKHLPLIQHASPFYPYGGIGVFKNFWGIQFAIDHSINRGAAWGLFSEFQVPLLILRIAIVVGIFWYIFLYRKRSIYYAPFTLILVGAVGNIIDFFFYGHVIDIFNFIFWSYDYPIFNIADSSICLGTLWLAIKFWEDK